MDNDRVIDSRASHDGLAIRRRRECAACQTRYSTFERMDDPVKCPFCHDEHNRVIDSDPSEGGFAVLRRRECLSCRRQYSTVERCEERVLKVVKKDGARVPFERQKIKRGLEKACWKRPISDNQIEALVTHVEEEIRNKLDAEVHSKRLGEMVMEQLRQLDHVAFVRFASVYREFKDVRDFVEELEPILAETRLPPTDRGNEQAE